MEFAPRAERYFRALDGSLRKRIARRIDALAQNPYPAGIKKLAGDEQIYRLRVRDYRTLYQVKRRALLIVSIGQRREFYRRIVSYAPWPAVKISEHRRKISKLRRRGRISPESRRNNSMQQLSVRMPACRDSVRRGVGKFGMANDCMSHDKSDATGSPKHMARSRARSERGAVWNQHEEAWLPPSA
jgi:mRNA interferase RelE/StbE